MFFLVSWQGALKLLHAVTAQEWELNKKNKVDPSTSLRTDEPHRYKWPLRIFLAVCKLGLIQCIAKSVGKLTPRCNNATPCHAMPCRNLAIHIISIECIADTCVVPSLFGNHAHIISMQINIF